MSDRSDPVIVVSSDTHVGPRVVEDLRPYCPARALEEFDAFTSALPEDRIGGAMVGAAPDDVVSAARRKYRLDDTRWNARSAGHYDVHTRLKDMDRDGVACEVVFHGSANGEPIPFYDSSIRAALQHPERAELAAVGLHIYNEWLADFCSVEPERHVGLCHVPMWDIDASIAEVVWAHEHGLKGVNFPAPHSQLPSYEDPAWDPFFAVCADRNMVLATHVGGGESSIYSMYRGPAAVGAFMIEDPWLGRRGMWLLTFTGAFERHPGLKLALTELPGAWWELSVQDMDAVYFNYRAGALREFLPKKPSEYVATNVFVGASFMSRREAELAVTGGYDDRFLWGSDYPHVEGTWMFTEHVDDPSVTRLSLSNTYHDLPASSVRRMTGENAIACYGIDANALARVAERVGPTLSEVLDAPDLSLVPAGYHGSGFRVHGAMS